MSRPGNLASRQPEPLVEPATVGETGVARAVGPVPSRSRAPARQHLWWRTLIPMISFAVGFIGVVLVIAGLVMVAQGWAGRRDVSRELAKQRISFPDGAALPADLTRFAGVRVQTGTQARAYSELIGVHVAKATGGRTYSEIADECLNGGRGDERLARLRETAFMGQSLRGALLGAYQAWQVTLLVMGMGGLLSAAGAAFLALAVETA
jgi:hypothetical protein